MRYGGGIFRMAFRYFITKDESWLLKRLGEIEEEEGTGKTDTSWGMGEVSGSQVTTAGNTSLKARILHDLNVLNPTAYPLNDTHVPTRTIATFCRPS